MDIDLDQSFLLQMLVFATLIVVLKPLLFDPLLAIFQARELHTEGARAQARALQEQAGVLLKRYEGELLNINRAAAEERERMATATARLEAEMQNAARLSTSRIIEDGRRQIEQSMENIRTELERSSRDLAQELATRALGREVN